MTFPFFALACLALMAVAAAPVWPWSRRLGARPLIVALLCLTLYVLFLVWTA